MQEIRNGEQLRDSRAVLLCGHGSRDKRAIEEFQGLASALQQSLQPEYRLFAHGFLEFARPTLREALEGLRAAGARTIDAVPGMLLGAGHAKNDIPALLRGYVHEQGAHEQGAHERGIEIRYGVPLGLDSALLRVASQRVLEAFGKKPSRAMVHDTLLVLVGRGASDPDANGDIAKLTRLLWEGLGFGWALPAYSGVTFPLVAPTLARAVRLGFSRIVVFPYFLFVGRLVERIYRAVDSAQAQFPEIEFLKAPYLNCHEDVVDCFARRVREIESGDGAMMNCALCKYRELIVGFEAEQGAPQQSHHQHVEGIGSDELDHHHNHNHPPHHHSHAPYPHADHPLGAKTLKEVES